MAKPKTIASLIPTALANIGQRALAPEEDLRAAKRWILDGGFGFVGNETKEERSALMNAFCEAAEFLAQMRAGMEPRWLTLVGSSGVGKSMLARRIALYVSNWGRGMYLKQLGDVAMSDMARDYSGRQRGSSFISWPEICTIPRTEVFDNASNDWFKVIDELKPQFGDRVTIDGEAGVTPKAFEITAADDILNARLRKWTIITSNLTQRNLAVFWDARIASRLMRDGSKIIDMSDIRDFNIRVKKHTT